MRLSAESAALGRVRNQFLCCADSSMNLGSARISAVMIVPSPPWLRSRPPSAGRLLGASSGPARTSSRRGRRAAWARRGPPESLAVEGVVGILRELGHEGLQVLSRRSRRPRLCSRRPARDVSERRPWPSRPWPARRTCRSAGGRGSPPRARRSARLGASGAAILALQPSRSR